MAEAQYETPEDYKSGLKDVLKEAKQIYETQKGLGYQTYTGDQIAGFSPDELAAMQGIAGLVGAGQQYFAPATALTMGQTQQFTPQMAAQYMSPYQQAVVDVEKREAIRQSQVPMQNIAAQAAKAGSFGGSRQAILEAERQRNLQQQLGNIQAKGSQAAYESGLRAFEAQKERERAAASGLAALGQAAPKQAMTELTALAGIGEAQRGMTQAGLDIARSEFEAQKQFPYDTLAQYQSTLYGYPYQSTSKFNPYQAPQAPSSMQNLAGVLGAVGKIGSSFGFFNSGGRVAFKSQGGLSGMIKQMAGGTLVGDTPPELTRQASRAALAQSLMELMKGQTSYQDSLKSALEEQAKLQEERKEKLEKQTSVGNYISDLLLGYAAADPRAGFGVQAASAVDYASGERDAAMEAIQEIEDQLATGKLTQQEANLKMQQLQLSTLVDVNELLQTSDYTQGLDIANKLNKFAENLNISPNNRNKLINQALTNVRSQEGFGDLTETQQEEAVMNEMTRLAPTYISSGTPAGTSVTENIGDASTDESVSPDPATADDILGVD